MEENDDDVENSTNLKLIIIGDSATGKTSIVNRFTNNTFDITSIATIVPNCLNKVIIIIIKINDIIYNINIWDLPGQDRNPILTKGFVNNSQGIIFCCEVNNENSKVNLNFWNESLKSFDNIENIPKIIIINKSDLLKKKDNNNIINNMKDISKDLGCFNCFLTSAKTGENVNDAFNFLINEMIKNVKENDIQSYNQIKLKQQPNDEKTQCC